MIPVSFSVKGYASITFRDMKDNLDANKIWRLISQVWGYYPEKIELMMTTNRGDTDGRKLEDPTVLSATKCLIGGCIETYAIKEAVGKSVNLLLGQCYEYKIPFGTRSADTGHETMVITLPFPMSGCYIAKGSLTGSLKRKMGKEHYMVDISLDIYIGELDHGQYSQIIERGIKVYPFKLSHPEYFPKDDSSGSEYTTDQSERSEDEDVDGVEGAISKKKRNRSMRKKAKLSLPRKVVTAAMNKLSHAEDDEARPALE